MITPPYLKKKDKIGIVAPARKIDNASIEKTVALFNNYGLEVVLGNNLFNSCNQFSGTIAERTTDMQYFLDNRDIKAIICARGGYGSVQLIDRLDFTQFIIAPKWLVGYSDITVFHSHINRQFAVETLHAAMPINLSSDNHNINNFSTLINALTGTPITYEIDSFNLNKTGIAQGELVGGNLSMLYSLIGSNSDIDTAGKILFIEDIDEYLYHIDRMMMNLKRNNKLENIKGLIVGGMTDIKDNEIKFGENAYEIISRIVKDYSYPVCYNFPAGHGNNNFALILGRKVELSIQNESCKLIFNNIF